MAKPVTSTANPTAKKLAGLRLKKYRQETGLFLAEGARTALDALNSGVVPKILAYDPSTANSSDAQRLRVACEHAKGECLEVTGKVLAKITRKDNPQPVIAAYACDIRPLSALKPPGDGIVVALDRIRDPGNLGTIIRTADAVAVSAVVLIGDSCDPYSPESVRASMGSIFNVPIHAGDESAFIALAKTWPGAVAGAAASAPVHYRDVEYRRPVLAVLGTEQTGLSAAITGVCNLRIHIPIFGKPESLNLAVACGIFLYAIRESNVE